MMLRKHARAESQDQMEYIQIMKDVLHRSGFPRLTEQSNSTLVDLLYTLPEAAKKSAHYVSGFWVRKCI